MDQAVEHMARTRPVPHCHLEGIDGEVRAQGLGDLPTDDHAREDVDDESGVETAAMGFHVGEVGNPELVGRSRGEVAIDQVGRTVLAHVGASDDLVGLAPPHS